MTKFNTTKLSLIIVLVALIGFSLPTGARNGTIRVALPSNPDVLDPALTVDGNSAVVMSNIMEGLLGIKQHTGEIIPVLAKSWEAKQNGKVFIFHLRQGVKFHDGTKFDAEAVKFNMERQMPPNKTEDMPSADQIYGNVEEVEVLGEYEVKVTLNSPDVTFLTGLAQMPGGPMVSPEALKENPDEFKKNPVGTGPFQFVEWVPDQYVRLKAFEDYWGGEPKADQMVYKVIEDAASRTSSLLAGEVDILPWVNINHLERLKRGDMNIIEQPGWTLNYIAFYTDQEPFNDKKVRKAIFMGVNRKKLVKGLYGNHAVVANGIIPPGVLGHSDELFPPEYDPERARELLKEAGYEDGLSFKLLAYNVKKNYNPAGEKLALIVKDQLKDIGVEVDVIVKPWSEFLNLLFSKEHKVADAVQIGWGSTTGDPSSFTLLLRSKQMGTGLNFAEYENPKIDELSNKAKTVADQDERAEVYREIQNIVNEELPWLFISHSIDYSATRPDVVGYGQGVSDKMANVYREE